MAKSANEALLEAAESGCLSLALAALDAGADVDYTGSSGGAGTGTALFIACYKGRVDVMRMLLSKGASVWKRAEGTLSSPLHIAAGRGDAEVVDLLVHHGATLDIKDTFQRTPLMTACLYKRVDAARRLIELGARVDLSDSMGHSTLSYCGFDAVGEDLEREKKELTEMIQEARKSKLLRCCNPTCGKPGRKSTLKLCAQCKLTRYCGRDCQKQHWSVGHKKSCGHDAYTGEVPTKETPFLKDLLVNLPNGATLLCQRLG
ncbi:uncharacterized protein LOC144916961 [Branchiostoma floridae x Branchiostoma belcheri]